MFQSLKKVLSKSNEANYQGLIKSSTYRQAKDLAQEYNKAKKLLYKQLKDNGYGAWELMKKPVELDQFDLESN